MKRNIRIWLISIAVFAIGVCIIALGISWIPSVIPASSQSADARTDAVKEKKSIVFSFGGNDTGGSIKSMILDFEKSHPDFDVKIQQLPNSTDYQKNFYKRALYSGDSSIDVFFSDIIWTAEFASSGWVLPLDQYFNGSELSGFLKTSLEGSKYKGKLYAVPVRSDIPLLYYRSDIIKTPPKTYKEMIELSNKYAKPNGIKYGYVFQGQAYEGLVCTALEFIWNNGGNVITNGKVTINSPESVEGLQSLVDLVNSGVSPKDVFNFQEEDARIAFQDGNALFMRNWPYAYVQLASENSKVKGKFNVAALPLGPNGKLSRGALGGWSYMINKNTKNLDAALTFVKSMSSHDAEVIDSVTGGFLPSRKDVFDDPGVMGSVLWMKSFKNALENANLRPVSPNYSNISYSMQVNFSNSIQGKISAASAIENIEKDLKAMYSNGK